MNKKSYYDNDDDLNESNELEEPRANAILTASSKELSRAI